MGETLTDFASGVGKGIDRQLAVHVELAPALVEQGVSESSRVCSAASSAAPVGRIMEESDTFSC